MNYQNDKDLYFSRLKIWIMFFRSGKFVGDFLLKIKKSFLINIFFHNFALSASCFSMSTNNLTLFTVANFIEVNKMAIKKDNNQSDKYIYQVWLKAIAVDKVNPDEFRKDYAGAWIRFSDYGNRNSQYGWEIDHLKPLSQNGTDELSNYFPLQWQNNVRKGDDYPRWATEVSSEGIINVRNVKYWKVNF